MMGDIAAISLLEARLEKLKKLKSSLTEKVTEDAFRTEAKKACVETAGATKEVKEYAERIQTKLKEVGLEAKAFTAAVQQKIKELFEDLKPMHQHNEFAYGTGVESRNQYGRLRTSIDKSSGTEGLYEPDHKNLKTENLERLETALVLQKLAKDVNTQRLDELVAETVLALENTKSSSGLTVADISSLNGCLDSWKQQENLSFKTKQEEEKKRKDKEAKRKLEEERKKREEEKLKKEKQQRQKEEAEKKRKEEEEEKLRNEKRKKEEEEERKRTELEERKRKSQEEAEEARRRAEKERQAHEEKLRRQKEEEDRKRKEREERERQEEEERKRKEKEQFEREEKEKREREEREREQKRLAEQERKRQLEEKRKEKERKKQEEEARKHRQDPENWSPIVYGRSDQVDSDRSHHKGIGCIVCAPEGSFKHDDAISIAGDEVDGVIEGISPGERVASSIIRLSSTRGEIRPEVPLRVHVPHVPVTDGSEEVVIMYSLNDSEQWTTKYPGQPTKKAVSSENVKLSCLEVAAFETLTLVVVVRQKGEVIIVDPPGKCHQLDHAKNTKVFIARDTFMERTEVRIAVKTIHLDDAASVMKPGDDVLQEVLSVSPLYTIQCQRPPSKSIELDLSRKTGTKPRGRLYQVYRTKDGQWNLAQTEVKGIQNDVSVTLPPHKGIYSFLEIEMSTQRSQEAVFKAAEALFSLATQNIVQVLTRQQSADPSCGVLHIVSRDVCDGRIQELIDRGFDYGGSCSSAFCLQDGDKIQTRISGNIGFAPDVVQPIILTYSTLMDRARMHLTFVVKDQYSQRDFNDYIGRLICEVVPIKHGTGTGDGLKVELPIHLPKQGLQQGRAPLKFVPVRFPYYLTALTTFLAIKLLARTDVGWMDVMKMFANDKKMKQLERQARNKCDAGEEAKVCRTVLLDWMKEQPRHIDKVKPILDALLDCQIIDLHDECKTFVEYFKDFLSDEALRDVISSLTGSPTNIGQALGFTDRQIEEIVKPDTNGPSEKLFLLLAEWRETDRAVKCGLGAFKELQSLLSKFKT